MLKRFVNVPVFVAAALAALGCTEGPVAVETIDSPAFAVVTISATSVMELAPRGGRVWT